MSSHKNVFIAVGSTAIGGLKQLILRLKEEGVYSSHPDDIFFAVDSDQRALNELKNIDSSSKTQRIHSVKISMDDNTRQHYVVGHFVPEWKSVRGIGVDGVGGQRWLSYINLSWSDFWDNNNLDDQLQPQDNIVLLGSAFGGTSTGMYWNMAEYIQSRLASLAQRRRLQQGSIRFFSLVLLPEAKIPPVGSMYRTMTSRNFCAFLRDMQVNTWRFELRSRFEKKEKIFDMPVYSGWDKEHEVLPIFTMDAYKCQKNSSLPFDILFPLPTTNGGQARSPYYFAESCFTLFYLGLGPNLCSKAIDISAGIVEKPIIGGMNYTVARSASNTILKNRFYTLLESEWGSFWNDKADEKDISVKKLRDFIKRMCDDISKSSSASKEKFMEQLASLKSDIQNDAKLYSQNSDCMEKINGFVNNHCSNLPYAWPTFTELLEAVRNSDMAAGGEFKLEKLPLQAFIQAYRLEYEDIHRRAQEDKNIRTRIVKALEKAAGTLNQRKRSKVASLLGAQDAVVAEVRDQLKNYVFKKLDELVDACRCAATTNKMLSPDRLKNVEQVPEFNSAKLKLEKLIEASKQDTKSGENEFIYTMEDKDVNFNLSNCRTNFMQLCIDIILSNDGNTLETAVKEAELFAIEALREEAKSKLQANPLRNLKIKLNSISLNSYSSSVYKVEKPDPTIFHFCYVVGSPENVTWPKWDLIKSVFPSFDQFRQGEQDEKEANLLDHKRGIEGKSFIENVLSSDFANVQGVWLGTADIARDAGEVLSSVFRQGQLSENWQKESWDAEGNGAEKIRLISLSNMVYLGVTLGAIEQKILKTNGLTQNSFNNARISIHLSNKTKDEPVIQVENATAENLGFRMEMKDTSGARTLEGKSDKKIVIRMASVPLLWIDKLMRWFNDRETGFIRDFELNESSLAGELLFEKQCISRLQLSVPPEILDHIEALYDRIYESIEVSVR